MSVVSNLWGAPPKEGSPVFEKKIFFKINQKWRNDIKNE